MDFSQHGEDAAVEGTAIVRPEPPAMVPGRILFADADFLAYHNGYRWETESLSKSIESLRVEIQTLRIMAGAQYIELHLTMGNKGGRYELAKVKEYQGKRVKSEGLAARVSALREYMANCTDPEVMPVAWTDQEADDGLCQRMYDQPDNVLWSLDKDLFMVPGLHLNGTTYELEDFTTDWWTCTLDRSTSQAKVVGRGFAFFWHQLLMGDGADDIPGLPALSSTIMMNLKPTAAQVKAEERVKKAKTAKAMGAARRALGKVYDAVKAKPCGPVLVHLYLSRAKSNKQAFQLCRDAYIEYYGPGTFDFTDWQGNVTQETAGSMMVEQARLLWMRRKHGEDVLEFFKEIHV